MGSNPASATINTIDMNLTSIVLTLWELPQIAVGRLVSRMVGTYAHTADGVRVFVTDRFDGLSLGDTVFVNPGSSEGTWLVRHEFGHVVQSRYLGWLYIPLVVIPSFLWCMLVSAMEKADIVEDWKLTLLYHQFYTERWANWIIS